MSEDAKKKIREEAINNALKIKKETVMEFTVTKAYAEDGKLPEIYHYPSIELFAKEWPLFVHPIRTYGDRFQKMTFALDTESVTIERL